MQLKELWVEPVSSASEQRIIDECAPGRPISVFTSSPHKVFRVVEHEGLWDKKQVFFVMVAGCHYSDIYWFL